MKYNKNERVVHSQDITHNFIGALHDKEGGHGQIYLTKRCLHDETRIPPYKNVEAHLFCGHDSHRN